MGKNKKICLIVSEMPRRIAVIHACPMLHFFSCPFKKQMENKAVNMALLHDIQETIIGDYTPEDNITPQEKSQKELQAIKKIAKSLEKPEIFALFEELPLHGSCDNSPA